MRNNNNKGSRSNKNKHELLYGESSSKARDAPDVCLLFVLLFTIFVIVVTQNLVLQQSKNVIAKCTENLSPLLVLYILLKSPAKCAGFLSQFLVLRRSYPRPRREKKGRREYTISKFILKTCQANQTIIFV